MARELFIRLENVHKTLGTKKVLKGVTLSVYKGETLVIVGRSGIGKSVTIKHMIGLLKPDEGTVTIEGRDISKLTDGNMDQIYKRFGVLFQDGALIRSLNVFDNVALPLREHTNLSEEDIRAQVRAKLALVHLDDVEEMMPSVLSGGMKKRVGLARALIRDPEIILYDEPTAGLDPIMSSSVNELIIEMKTKLGVTNVVVTHDMPSVFRIADRIAMLYNGKIIKEDAPSTFLESGDPLIKSFIFGDEEDLTNEALV
jgi:phospholipid/cholesterol/gamma-HCH transport system ATP-binding protein